MRCRFSALVLRQLLRAGADVRAVILPGPPTLAQPLQLGRRPSLPMAGTSESLSVDVLATQHALPLFQAGQLASVATLDVVRATRPELIVVACYPALIPAQVRQAASVGAFNIHPSLLPDKRGPDPWFWTFRDEAALAGVTVHHLTGRYDAGAIAAQEAWPLTDGVTEAELEHAASERGADLFLNVARRAMAGTLQLRAQDDASATWARWPTAADYVLDEAMSARGAFNFARGVRDRGEPLRINLDGAELRVDDVLSYHTTPERSADILAGVTQLRFRDGVVLARVTPVSGVAPSGPP